MGMRRCITALIACILAVATMQGQAGCPKNKTNVIEVFLDNAPTIHGYNLNFNDFFSESHITAKVYANDDSIAEKIKIKRCKTLLSGNSDPYSLETAEKLLKESSKNIIRNHKWKPGKSECTVRWKPRHNLRTEQKEKKGELLSFISEAITDKTKRKLHRDDCSAFIHLQFDHEGRILNAKHIGNIFWETGKAGWRCSTEEVSVSAVQDYRNGNAHNSIMFKPKSQPARYMDKWELRVHHADKQLRKNMQKIARELKGKQFSELAGKEGYICIEIHIDTSDIEIEEIDPVYPGGAKALKEYYAENFKYSRRLRRNKIKGNVNIELLIKKSGKAKLQNVNIHERTFSYEGMDSWDKISNDISHELNKITEKMPRWTPGIYDGKKIEKNCSFRLRLDCSNY